MRIRIVRWVLATVAAALCCAAIAAPAEAHWADQAVAEVVVGARSVRVTLTLPTGLLSRADTDGDGHLSSAELETYLRSGLTVTDGPDRGTLQGLATRAPADAAAAATHTTLDLAFAWPHPLRALTLRYDLFLPDVPTASCLATIVRGGRVQTFVFTPQRRELALESDWVRRLGSFVALGIEHIASGYDHILFLLSLLMLGGSLRGLLKVVTAFTAAHSITLSLAVLNIVRLPGRWVESAIALSIVYVAVENLLRTGVTLRRRWAVTFGFGLVHGLGFAAVLQALQLPAGALASSLIGFNIGVELGQMAIVAAAFLLLRAVERWPRMSAARRWMSATTALVGLVWFIQRTFHG